MELMDLAALNSQFAIGGHISFKTGPGNIPVAEINNNYASAAVSLMGGHVLAFQPHGQQPVLWLSSRSHYEPGKAIRGGIPVCWPWFAVHPTDPHKPAHGFVRTMPWSVEETRVAANGASYLRLGLSSDQTTQVLWSHPFQLQLAVTVGPELQVDLAITNPGSAGFNYTGALHSYFSVSNIGQVTLHGLDGCDYLDKVDNFKRKTQQGPVIIEAETDRIYLETTAACVIQDKGWTRSIQIAKSGSRTTVVWNPWQERARQLPDMAGQSYIQMVCVETANAADDVVTVPPGGESHLRAIISVR